jgi:hypothetical protein
LKATSLFAPQAPENSASSGGESPMKPAPFALDPEAEADYGKKGIQMDDFMQQARENFESARAAYDAQKAKVRKSSM